MTISKGKESRYKKIISWTNIKKVVVGGYFEFAGLRNDGTVVVSDDFSWDYFDPKITPSAVSGWRDIVDIACNSDYFIIGLKKDGTVVYAGKLYSSAKKDDNIIDVSTLNTWTDIIAIYPSGSSVIGLKSDGTLLFAGISNYNESVETSKWQLW